MALSPTNKTLIDTIVPVSAAAATGYTVFMKKGKNWKISVGAALFVLIVVYIIVSSSTKAAAETPPSNGNPNDPNVIDCSKYNPQTLATELEKDIECNVCLRNRKLYTELLARTDCEFIKVYNYWNNNFYRKNKETLARAIANESDFFDREFGALQMALAEKFKRLKLE